MVCFPLATADFQNLSYIITSSPTPSVILEIFLQTTPKTSMSFMKSARISGPVSTVWDMWRSPDEKFAGKTQSYTLLGITDSGI